MSEPAPPPTTARSREAPREGFLRLPFTVVIAAAPGTLATILFIGNANPFGLHIDGRALALTFIFAFAAAPFFAEAASGHRAAQRWTDALAAAFRAALAGVTLTLDLWRIALATDGLQLTQFYFLPRPPLYALTVWPAALSLALFAAARHGQRRAARDDQPPPTSVTRLYDLAFLLILVAFIPLSGHIGAVAFAVAGLHALPFAWVLRRWTNAHVLRSMDLWARSDRAERARDVAAWSRVNKPGRAALYYVTQTNLARFVYAVALVVGVRFIQEAGTLHLDGLGFALLVMIAWTLFFVRDHWPEMLRWPFDRWIEIGPTGATGGRYFLFNRSLVWEIQAAATKNFLVFDPTASVGDKVVNPGDAPVVPEPGLYQVNLAGEPRALDIGAASIAQRAEIAAWLNAETTRLWGAPESRYSDV